MLTNPTGPSSRPLRTRATVLALAMAMLLAPPAAAMVGDAAVPQDAPVTSTWFVLAAPEAQATDRAYVEGMRPHHEGALTMSQEYLADPGRSSPLLQALARAIMVNQEFEIGVLDDIVRNLDQPPLRLPFGLLVQRVATVGMGEAQRFFKEPVPSPLATPIGPVSERDVMFAKAMIIHHDGALAMARGYHADPRARNGFLHLMNTDILTDQSQEIALMRLVIAAYPGDAGRIVVDPSMVHGMEGMDHGHGAHRH